MAEQQHPLLTNQKLLEILQKVEGTRDVEILKADVEPGTAAGDNYSSEVVRCDVAARVRGEKKEYHWMLKLTSTNQTFAQGMHMEAKEIIFYRDILPKWNALAEEKGASFRLNCFATPYTELHDDPGKRNVLAMQNLRHLGYADAPDKKKGLSLAHAKVVLAEIARFHSLGYLHLTTHPGGLEAGRSENEVFLTDDTYVRPPETARHMFEHATSQFADFVELVQEPGQDLVGIYRRFASRTDPYGHYRELCDTNRDGFNVVCHGDLWFNNMLFKHAEDGTPLKASLLDVSISKWASPCVDLAYFLYSSTTPSLRTTHLDEMLGHYHDTFMRCLAELGLDPTVYPYRTLLADFNKYSFIGFWFSFMALPAILAKKEDAIGQDDIQLDPDHVEDSSNLVHKLAITATKHEPQIKIMLNGTFLDMIKRGIFPSK